jgi:hypothetical protein
MVLVALAAGVIAAPGLVAPLPSYDGGITSSAGTFILHGQLPYRDFWLLYGPLAGYVAAILSALLGNHVFVMRLAGLFLVMLTAAVGYRLITSVAPGIRGAFVAVMAATIPTYFVGLDLAPWPLAMALALLALDVARGSSPRCLVAAGALVGLATLARLDLGAYALIAVVIQSRSLRPAVGAATVFAPVALIFLILVPLPAVVSQLIWYPLVGTQEFRRLPGPTLGGVFEGQNPVDWTVYYVPVFLILGVIARRLWTGSIPAAIVGLAVLAAMSRLQVVGRADSTHAAEVFTPGLLLVVYVVGPPSTFPRRLGTALAGTLLLGIAALPLLWLVTPPDPYDRVLTEAASIVRSRTLPDEPIFVGEVINTRVYDNPMFVYFLADRPTGVRDSLYNPGVTTTAATQQRMVDDLAAHRVRYLVLDVRYAGCYETANQSRLPGSTILDTTIARDYRVVANFGAVVVMAARDINASAVPAGLWVDPGGPGTEGPVTCPGAATRGESIRTYG